MPVNSTRVAVSNQLCLSKLALREALEPLQVQTFGLKISRSTYARINLRPDSGSVFLIESWHQNAPSIKVFGHLKWSRKDLVRVVSFSWNEKP